MTRLSPDPGNTPEGAPERVSISTPVEVPAVVSTGVPTAIDARTTAKLIDHDNAPRDPKRRPPPAWSSPREACILIARGHTLRTGVMVASVVGTVLSGVNEGATIASGHLDVSTWARIATNYLVPFLVASVGCLAPFRRRSGTNR